MFFELNGVVYDSVKLESKRSRSKVLLEDCLKKSCLVEELDDNTFFVEDSLLIARLDFFPVEDFCVSNFSF